MRWRHAPTAAARVLAVLAKACGGPCRPALSGTFVRADISCHADTSRVVSAHRVITDQRTLQALVAAVNELQPVAPPPPGSGRPLPGVCAGRAAGTPWFRPVLVRAGGQGVTVGPGGCGGLAIGSPLLVSGTKLSDWSLSLWGHETEARSAAQQLGEPVGRLERQALDRVETADDSQCVIDAEQAEVYDQNL